MSVQNPDWSFQQDSPIFREPDPPVSSDSDSGHQLVEGYEGTSVQAPTGSSSGPPCLDINEASSWPVFWTILQQLPPQDSDERYCLALGEEELAQLRLFCAQRNRESLGQGVARLLPPKFEGHTCEKCKKLLNPGEYGVFAARAGERCCWHRPCFACQACGQALINLIYFYHDGHLYCGRHHAELLRPRCPACDQLIFSQHCTEAEGRRWHENHFCCQDCAGPLGAGPYALPGGSPCCPSCFVSRYQSADSNSQGALEGQASLAAPRPSTATPRCEGASGPAALTARPWPARSESLLNPPGGAAAPVSLPGAGDAVAHWWTEAGAPGVDSRQRRRARHSLGRGGRLHATLARLLHRDLGADMGISNRSGTGETGPDPSVGWTRASSDDKIIFRAALSTTVASPSLETPSPASKGQDQDRPQSPGNPKEDSPCPTCSSSSESEPEGFFFGQRLPGPWKTSENLQADDRGISRKHCTIC